MFGQQTIWPNNYCFAFIYNIVYMDDVAVALKRRHTLSRKVWNDCMARATSLAKNLQTVSHTTWS